MKWECELISFEVPPLGYRPAGQGNGKHVCLSRLLSRPDLGLRSGFAIGRPNQVSGGNYPCVLHFFFLFNPDRNQSQDSPFTICAASCRRLLTYTGQDLLHERDNGTTEAFFCYRIHIRSSTSQQLFPPRLGSLTDD